MEEEATWVAVTSEGVRVGSSQQACRQPTGMPATVALETTMTA